MKTTISFLLLVLCQFHECELPDEVQRLIDTNSIALIHKDSLVDDWTLFINSNCPTIAVGDFNGDGINDYGILARTSTEDKNYSFQIVQSNEDDYELIHIMDIGFGIYDGGLGFGIETVSAKRQEEEYEIPNAKHASIIFIKFESSSQLIYFDGKEYQTTWIGD